MVQLIVSYYFLQISTDDLINAQGIAFSLIILRIGLGMSVDDTVASSRILTKPHSHEHDERRVNVPMRTLSIRITETTDIQHDHRRSSIDAQDDAYSTKVGSLSEKVGT